MFWSSVDKLFFLWLDTPVIISLLPFIFLAAFGDGVFYTELLEVRINNSNSKMFFEVASGHIDVDLNHLLLWFLADIDF